MRYFLIGLAAYLLASCASVSSDYQFAGDKSVGLAIGSITFESSIGQYGLVAQRAADGKKFSFKVGSSLWSPFSRWFDPELKSRGGTYAVELPVGRYSLTRWEVFQGSRHSVSSQHIPVTFYIEQGKATYLGNLHFGEDWLVSLRDRADRDLPLLKNRIPALNGVPVEIVIDKNGELKGVGGRYYSSML